MHAQCARRSARGAGAPTLAGLRLERRQDGPVSVNRSVYDWRGVGDLRNNEGWVSSGSVQQLSHLQIWVILRLFAWNWLVLSSVPPADVCILLSVPAPDVEDDSLSLAWALIDVSPVGLE